MTDAGDELVAVPRSLLGAACAAIRGKRNAPNTLSQLNRYAAHGTALSSPASSSPAEAEALPDGVDAELIEQARRETAWALNRWKRTMFTPELVEAIFTAPALSKLLSPAPAQAGSFVASASDRPESGEGSA